MAGSRSSVAVAPAPEKKCTLADHDALPSNGAAWQRCALVGYITNPLDRVTYEQRNCPRCGSTVSKAGMVVLFRGLDEPAPEAPPAARLSGPKHDLELRGAA